MPCSEPALCRAGVTRSGRAFRTVAVLLGMLLCGLASAAESSSPGPDARLWCALLVGTRERNPPSPPAAIASYLPVLRRTFGYDRFDLIAERLAVPGPDDDRWLVPSTELYLQVRSRPVAGEGRSFYQLRMFQRERALFASEIGLSPGSPLYIRGPLWGQGQLILILELRP